MSLLDIDGVSVRFGGLTAVDDARLTVQEGAVTGLIGPNGAGKTTLFNVITGLQAPTSGRVLLDGTDISAWKPQQRARRGIARTFQRIEVFGSLSVFDNVLTAAELRRSWSTDGEDPRAVAAEQLARVGIEPYADVMADAVPTGVARLVELARALALRPRLLLLDEPSSGLSEEETHAFAGLLREVVAVGGSVLIVEHDVDLVMGLCSTIHVLDFGRVICSGPPSVVQADPAVQQAYLGTAEPEAARKQALA
ncbi:MAG: ABC transporter ATP-binding protein [Frankiales bacterium]|nr:ABC transporter ATP-binding protein [Frankiales bacterium]